MFPPAVPPWECFPQSLRNISMTREADGKKTVMVAIMPCTAKKAEAIRPNSFTHGEQDTDIVITTMELIRMIDNFGLDFASLDPEACDMPFASVPAAA